MAANEIKITIGGDASGIQKAAAQTATSLTNIGKAAAGANTTISKSTPGLNQATQSLTNLSRVAQDAPFGFIGIQNNLNPLLESFGRLRQETGSTGAAFKSLAAGLAGPAGIGLALGVVSGIITVAVQKYGSLGNAISALFGEYSALDRANEELITSFSEATGKASAESAVINSLLGIARNENLSRSARVEAINKLNKEYDEFLPKLSLENINTQAVTDSVNKLNEALLRQAKIKGVQDLIAKEFQKLTETLTSAPTESLTFFDKLKLSLTSAIDPVKSASGAITTGLQRQGEAAKDAQDRIDAFNKVLNDLLTTEATEGTLFTQANKKGTDALKERVEQLTKLQQLAGLTTAQTVELAQLEIQLVQRDQAKLGFSRDDLQSAVDNIIARAFPEDFKMTIAAGIEIAPTSEKPDISKALGLDKITQADIDKAMEPLTNGLKESAKKAQRALSEAAIESLSNSLSKIAQETLQNSIVAFSEGIGNLIAQGGSLGDVFAGVFQAIGSGLQKLGETMLAYGLAVKAFKASINSLNAATAIAAGIGLIIAGQALKSFKIPGFADGVTNFRGGLALVGERGPELVNLPRGSDVIPNHLLGGGTNVSINVTGVIRGRDLGIIAQRNDERKRRLG